MTTNDRLAQLTALQTPAPNYDLAPSFASQRLKARQLSAKEYEDLLGQEDAVKMNYVPQMLEALAMEHIMKVKAICSLMRLREFKPYVKRLHNGLHDYAVTMARIYGLDATAYQEHVGYFLDMVGYHRNVMWESIYGAALRCVPSRRADVATHLAIIRGLIDEAERYSKQYDKRIHDALQRPVYRSQIKAAATIAATCREIEDKLGYRLDLNEAEMLNFKVMSTQAALLAVELVKYENKQQPAI